MGGRGYSMKTFVTSVVFLCCGFVAVSCFACLWDRDTLAMERQRFPTALELITGKFLRHSDAFYRWRVKDRQERIEAERSPELYDDLAVAHEKLGDTEEAIRVIRTKDEFYPGLYSTHANLGTFYFHSGQFASGLTEIDKALKINPDAHFGREIYQKRLVEYLLSKGQVNDLSLPLSRESPSGPGSVGFGTFLAASESGGVTSPYPRELIDQGITGVLGMMKFGNYNSPVLLEALGDLLVSAGLNDDAKQLAARAYLKASYEIDEKAVQQAYRDKAEASLKFRQNGKGGSHEQLTLKQVEAQFQSELNDANAWYKMIESSEKKWIATGKNVEQAFENTYYEAPVVRTASSEQSNYSLWVGLTAVWVSVVTVAIVIPVAIRRQRKNAESVGP